MNIEQQRVVDHLDGPAAVLAGAGSGKTHTLIGRIEKLSKVVKPERIVMLTFTNAAADEMKYRASKVNEECKNVIACTYHKYCGLMLRRYGKCIGIEPSYEILTGMKYKTLIEYVKSTNEYYESLKDFPSASKLDSIFSTVINNDDLSIEQLTYGTKYAKYNTEIQNLYTEIKQYGLENQKFNFDDLLVYMNQLLDNDSICERIAKSFDYLMVDEFQDTNTLQLNILLKLSRYNKNIVIVGDISQSIYKFRGARVENIENFIATFDDCDVYKLSINYRSTQEILDSVNSIMNENVRSWSYTDMVSNDRHGEKPMLIKNQNSYTQAEWIIQQINNYVDEGYDLSQIAIIERKSMSSFKLENELLKAKIPFIKKGGLKFTDYVCVDDMLSFFSVLVKNDKFSWFNVLKLIPGIGGKTATKIADNCNEEDFLDSYSTKKYGENLMLLKKNLKEFSVFKNDLNMLFKLVSTYYFDLRKAKIDSSAKMSSSAKFDAKEKIAKDKVIIDILKDMSTSYDNVKTFLEDIALDSLKTDESDEDRLMITTIHSAKGLEWPIVIIIDCMESDKMDDEEEELRCLYVAMTRAEKTLILSIPEETIVNGLPMYNDFTHFIYGSEDLFKKGNE